MWRERGRVDRAREVCVRGDKEKMQTAPLLLSYLTGDCSGKGGTVNLC